MVAIERQVIISLQPTSNFALFEKETRSTDHLWQFQFRIFRSKKVYLVERTLVDKTSLKICGKFMTVAPVTLTPQRQLLSRHLLSVKFPVKRHFVEASSNQKPIRSILKLDVDIFLTLTLPFARVRVT